MAKDFDVWYEMKGRHHLEHKNILQTGKLAIAKADQDLFWEYNVGLALFFWRWPEHYQDIAYKEVSPTFDSDPPRNLDL